MYEINKIIKKLEMTTKSRKQSLLLFCLYLTKLFQVGNVREPGPHL